ncbi:MAG: diphthamide biosynthesis enzyme Dph2 [Thermoprotei archaeon]|nr:MAG: diphthamide biosynthesis enzyme Dph2 [Thermoprotei archaeon]
MEFKALYSYSERKVINVLRALRPKRILIQLPEGLKRASYEIVDSVLRLARSVGLKDVEVNIDASPIYGSCLIELSVAKDYDAVLHFGHEEYPLWRPPENLFFIDLYSTSRPSKETINRLLKFLIDDELLNVALLTTAQHKNIINYVKAALEASGLNVVNNPENIVLGCLFMELDIVRERIDAVVVVAGGRFHAIGTGLRVSGSRPVIRLDPYDDVFEDLTPEVHRIISVRYGKIMRSLDARNWLIVTGIAGQYRPYLLSRITQLARRRDVKTYVARTAYVTRDSMLNLDSSSVDVIVVTSCPRIAIEDLSDYYKPVLTPGEALMILRNKLDSYIYPW